MTMFTPYPWYTNPPPGPSASKLSEWEKSNRDYIASLVQRKAGPCQAHDKETEKQEAVKAEAVNHPSHYTRGGIECIDAIAAATAGKKGIEATCVANILKYLWRYELKGGRQDVEKARWYLERLLKEIR